MATTLQAIKSASEAWQLLRGLVCLYKSSDYPIGTLIYQLKRSLANDLNEMRRSVELNSMSSEPQSNSEGLKDCTALHSTSSSEIAEYEEDYGLPASVNYATHPLVLGKGFIADDIHVHVVNPLARRESGLCLMTLNDPVVSYRLRAKKYPTTFRIMAELGKATDTGFLDGRTLQKSTYAHLKNRPQRFHSLLHSIQSCHQKEAFKYLKMSLQSQEAYEIAAQGPVRPENESGGLIYNIKCVHYAPPDITIDATCCGANGEYLASLIHEIGIKLKTSAVTTSVRVLRFGHFDLSSALLQKHCNLESVIQNICDNEAQLQLYGSPHKPFIERPEDQQLRSPHFQKLHSIRAAEKD